MYIKRKSFITKNERNYYNIIKEITDEYDLELAPQVSLKRIIYKKPKEKKFVPELEKYIDFGIFSKDYKKLLLLIEINDRTHKRKDKIERDENVKNYTKEAGINLISIITYKNCIKSNMNDQITYYLKDSTEAIKNRFLKELEIQK